MSVKIFSNLIPVSMRRSAEASWPKLDWEYWHRYKTENSNKFGSVDRIRIPVACLAAIDALALAVSPYLRDSFIDYDLHAAGLHMLPPGGFLTRHVDAECHPIKPWRRTHSVVMCVNEDWKSSWGGELSIEGHGVIPMEPGRVVIFETEGTSHEVFRIDASQTTQMRKTIALFAWKVDENHTGHTSSQFEKI